MSRKVFISYSRENKAQARDVEERLRRLGFDVWLDQALRGGQAWWEEVLAQIRASHAFVALVSTDSLQSRACGRERDYAEALGKPIVPVAVERLRAPMPTDLVSRQFVDYTPDNPDRAFALASALIDLPSEYSLPYPLPPAPEIPLSYLAHLVDLAKASRDLSRAEQLDILNDLEPGLRATDHEEREGAWHVLESLESRPDLYHDTARRVGRLRTDYHDKEPQATRPRSEGPTGASAAPHGTDDNEGPDPRPIVGIVLGLVGLAVLVALIWPDGSDLATPDLPGPPRDGKVEIVGTPIGDDVALLDDLATLSEETGIEVEYNSLPWEDFEAEIQARVRDNNAPDLVVYSFPGMFLDLGVSGDLQPMGDLVDIRTLTQEYVPGLVDAVTAADGSVYALPFSLEAKSLVWYPRQAFEAAGYQVPATQSELEALMDQIKADGVAPWCFGIDSGWPATDWIEEYVLRIGGPEVYDQWVKHEIPFNAPVALEAAQLTEKTLLTEGNTFGGRDYIAGTNVFEAANPMFTDPPGCMLHHQGSFILGFWPEQVTLNVAESVGVFLLPPVEGGFDGQSIVGSARFTGAFTNDEDVAAVLEALHSPDFGDHLAASRIWLSPLNSFDGSRYPNEVFALLAELASNADVFRFDGSDSMPRVARGTFFTGMTAWIAGEEDLDTTMQNIEDSWPTP